MLHTNRESYRLKSLQQKLENGAQNDTPLTLKEETLKSIQDRKALEETQKAEVDKFLKSISFSNGNIRSTISQEQKTILDSMLATLDIQKKENEILDTNVIRQKLGIQQETRQALAVERSSGTPDKKLAKGMAESVNPELAELKLFLIKNGYLDAKYTNTQIKYGNETVAAIKKYNEANPKNSLGNNPEEVSVKRVRELKDVQVIKSTPVAQPKVSEKVETPSTIVAKRVHKGADGKLPEISDVEKKATKSLQVALTTLGLYAGKDDGIFGQATEDAVKKFLASPDLRGNIPANTNPQEVTQAIITRIEESATKAQRIAAAPQNPVSVPKPQRRPSQNVSDTTPRDISGVPPRSKVISQNPSRLASEVVRDLETVNFFLDAHNRTYGERDSLISNRNGIVGIVWQLSNPDSRRLAGELGMSEDRIKAYGASLGLDNSKVTDGLIRMALIAVISGLLSGGASVALEILGINVSRDYKKGPEMKKILEVMGRKGDITSKRRDVLMDPRTTSRDVEAVGKAMRGKNLLPNNIRADVKKILSSDFFLFDIIADIFGNSQKKQMNALIDQFEKARNLDEAEFILTQIVQIATEEYYKKYPTGSTNNILDSLADSLKAIRDLKAKKDKIEGKGFDKKRYERGTGTIQAILDATYGKPEPHKGFKKGEMKLSSTQAYAPALPKNLNPSTLGDMLQKMANTVIPGDKYTILANLMRGVNFHTGISFKPDEFLLAFQNMRWLNNNERKAINKSILSNTGRQKNQQFNGISSVDSIAVMELNGQKVYFRGACTNVLPNIEDINTVIEVSSSIPVALPVPTGVGGWGGGGGGRGVTTRPVEEGSTTITNPSTTTTSGVFNNPTNPLNVVTRVPGAR